MPQFSHQGFTVPNGPFNYQLKEGSFENKGFFEKALKIDFNY